jgi:hypothetical protein
MLICSHPASRSVGVRMPMSTALAPLENRILQYAGLSTAAERHLISPGVVCPDHGVCTRLAFGRFLYLTGRINDDEPLRS